MPPQVSGSISKRNWTFDTARTCCSQQDGCLTGPPKFSSHGQRQKSGFAGLPEGHGTPTSRAENWCHIRTTNPIESTFATIRLRHRKTKNNGSARASPVMLFKLTHSSAKGWRKLRGHQHIRSSFKSPVSSTESTNITSNNRTLQAQKPVQLIPKPSPDQFCLNTTFGTNSHACGAVH